MSDPSDPLTPDKEACEAQRTSIASASATSTICDVIHSSSPAGGSASPHPLNELPGETTASSGRFVLAEVVLSLEGAENGRRQRLSR
jgi:hypothetical protein